MSSFNANAAAMRIQSAQPNTEDQSKRLTSSRATRSNASSQQENIKASAGLKPPGLAPLSSSKLGNQLAPPQLAHSELQGNNRRATKATTQMASGEKVNDTSAKSRALIDSLASRLASSSLATNPSTAAVRDGVHGSDVTKSQSASPDVEETSSKASLSDDEEVDRLRRQLQDAQDRIAVMHQELAHTRIAGHTLQQAIGSPVASDADMRQAAEQLLRGFHHVANMNSSAGGHDASDPATRITPKPSEASQLPWTNQARYEHAAGSSRPPSRFRNRNGWSNQPPAAPKAEGMARRSKNLTVGHRAGTPHFEAFDGNNPIWGQTDVGPCEQALRRPGRPDSSSGMHQNAGCGTYWPSCPTTMACTPGFSPPATPMLYQGLFPQPSFSQNPATYHPRPMGSRLSPTALEFQAAQMSSAGPFAGPAWNVQSNENQSSGSYMSHVEPLNYRRLLDKNMSCNWKYVVEKIVCSNDQQASIFLQQKLKIATLEQKFELVEAIIAQAYPLMVNRFGNFLVQRCFEHGTPEQVVAIANAIRGNTLALSMDPFGCHVVQKAFDAVPEDYKAVMVHELLRNIPETVIHRYACHVWQKLFELRWSDSPPQIMKFVNEALAGMWHEVALGETGSLVVQNIFENCLEEDKRPCIEEVISNIDIVSHGQFGNWCIQHICEHSAPADKSRAIEHVLRYAAKYSTDQFASKVVEKCLKVGGPEFLDRYLDRVCEGRADRPRMPLIDIAGDQYGNYLIQYILMNAEPQHRELVAQHVRKHMVSLRGSKFGSRVAMLCSNPAFATRPGHAMSLQMNNRFYHNTSPGPGMGGMGMSRHGMPGSYR